MKNFYVIEIQTNADGTCGNIVTGYEDRTAAETAYLTTRAAAAVSSVLIHTVLWIDKQGNTIEKKSYTHPAPEPEQAAE